MFSKSFESIVDASDGVRLAIGCRFANVMPSSLNCPNMVATDDNFEVSIKSLTAVP